MIRPRRKIRTIANLLLSKLDALGNVALQALVGFLEKLLLIVIGAADNIDSFLSTVGAKLNGDAEELVAGLLGDLSTTLNAWKVDVGGLDNASFAVLGTDDLLSESVTSVRHGEGSGTSASLGLDDLVTTELYACSILSVG